MSLCLATFVHTQYIQSIYTKIYTINITRDIEIKNKLTVTRGEMGGDNGGKRVKGLQGQL